MQSCENARVSPPPSSGGLPELLRCSDETSYPPYDIERLADDRLRISLAVAGFGREALSVLVEPNRLTVSGRAPRRDAGRRYLHRGIALRAFDRSFELDDRLAVDAAGYADGLLTIDLTREADAGPRRLGLRPLQSPGPDRPARRAIDGRRAA